MSGIGILLVGGGGFLGLALAGKLVELGYSVHVLSHHTPAHTLPNVQFHFGGQDDAKLLQAILPQCNTVIHLACATTPSVSAKNPAMEAALNIGPALEFLGILQEQDIKRLIYISSGGTVYGNPDYLPVDEDHPLRPLSYHGAGKLTVESFMRAFGASSDRYVSVLRPSNIYGPNQPLRSGFGVIRSMLSHLQAGTVMEIWGEGNTVRDFLYIDDMVDACCRLIDTPDNNEIYNVGFGAGYSLNQLVEIVSRVCEHDLQIVYSPERQVDVKGIVLDASRLKNILGWHPRVSLDEGVLRTWKWLQTK